MTLIPTTSNNNKDLNSRLNNSSKVNNNKLENHLLCLLVRVLKEDLVVAQLNKIIKIII